jgi:hypothetical protein
MIFCAEVSLLKAIEKDSKAVESNVCVDHPSLFVIYNRKGGRESCWMCVTGV